MNLHPLFVHFPIAFLTVYALMELVRFKKILNLPYWFYIKAVIVIVGGLGALAALVTGDSAIEAVSAGSAPLMISNFGQVVSLHENFADLSVAVFGILTTGYLILWLNKENLISTILTAVKIVPHKYVEKIHLVLVTPARLLIETRFVILLAIVGLVSITITGGLGGMMVYGADADPFFRFIYKLLFSGI